MTRPTRCGAPSGHLLLAVLLAAALLFVACDHLAWSDTVPLVRVEVSTDPP